MAEQAGYWYDLFVSYSLADREWVRGYLLPALGLPAPRLVTPDDFHPGAPLVDELERVVTGSRYTLLVLSPTYLADAWATLGEQLVSHLSVAERHSRLIPLLKTECELPLRLDFRVRLDCTDEANWEGEIARLRAVLAQPEPGLERIPCPYPGMVPFSEGDARHFFGREREIEELRRRLRHPGLTLVIGPSGSGKSSLIFAGLVPELHRQQPGEWLVRTMRPGATPLVTLQANLPDPALQPPDPPMAQPSGSPSPRLLLVVDQFEELFASASRSDQAAFIAALKELCQVETCRLVLTMRADFYPELMVSDLWPVSPGERLEVAPLRGAALREAIVRPAAAEGVYLEAGLAERLLADAAGEPGTLPLLQETMALLWEKRTRRLLPVSAYDRLGSDGRSGLAVAIATKADATLAALPAEQQAIARRILVRLVQFGEGRPDTRRQQPMTELRAGNDPALFDRTLCHLVDHRLLTLSGEEGDPDRRADLAHEALIDGWPAFQRWLAERREAEQARRRLEAKAAEWVRLGRGKAGLLDRVQLAEAQHWLASHDAADLGYGGTLTALVAASRSAIEEAERKEESARRRELVLERRARRRTQALAVILAALLLAVGAVRAVQEFHRQQARSAGVLQPVPGRSVAFERFEVTNRRYERCARFGPCSPPSRQSSTFFREGASDLPVTGVDAIQAAAFCRWIGRRLPTRDEWVDAVTNGGRTSWPWGAENPSPELADILDETVENPPQEPEVGGKWARDATEAGIFDLVGNVFEWTATSSDRADWDGAASTVPPQLVVEGISFMISATALDLSQDQLAGPDYRVTDLGFRCAASHDSR